MELLNDHVMNTDQPAPTPSLLVVCLCAEWCGVCRDYLERFEQAQAKFPQARFLWIDVEDEADLLDPLDVENFPTLLLAVGEEPRFFGPVLPSSDTLERMIRAQAPAGGATVLNDRAVTELLGRIRTAHQIA